MTMARSRSALMLLALAVTCSGCADPSPAPERPFPTYPVDPNAETPGAQIEGEIVLRDGCLLIRPEQPPLVVLVLPETAEWDASTQTVSVGEVSAAVGSQVSWTGSYGPADASFGGPEKCPTELEWARAYFPPEG